MTAMLPNVKQTHEYNMQSYSFALFHKYLLRLSYLIFSSLCWHWYSVWGLNSTFQSSNYKLGGAPRNPRDTSPCLCEEMGISHSFTACAISGVQKAGTSPKHLCLDFSCVLFKLIPGSAGGLWWMIDRQRFCVAELGRRWTLLLWCRNAEGKNCRLSKRTTLNWGGRLKQVIGE